ncbi:MAG TPA: hypothetical protein VFQ37_05755 [Mycobacterium sp.]|nr:hypothetical protein [Mycobacterium sp.]
MSRIFATQAFEIAGVAAAATALGFAAVGIGAGYADARPEPHLPGPEPHLPGPGNILPPGQLHQLPFVPPPGHWG